MSDDQGSGYCHICEVSYANSHVCHEGQLKVDPAIFMMFGLLLGAAKTANNGT